MFILKTEIKDISDWLAQLSMCLLCGDRTRKNCGPILTSLNCHLLCLKFSSGILDSAQPPRDVEVAREVRRVQKLKCVFCQEHGAFVGCNIKVGILLGSVSPVVILSMNYFLPSNAV